MERIQLLEHLSVAKLLVEEGEVHIAAQKRLIDQLSAAGGDVAAAQELLLVFAKTQESHLKYVESILDALDKLSPTEDGSQS